MSAFSVYWPPEMCRTAQRLKLDQAPLTSLRGGQKFWAESLGMRCGDVLFPITLVAGRPHVLAAVEALRELPIGRWQKEHPVDPAPSWAPRAKFVLECKPLEKLRFGQAITADGVERLVEPLLQPGVGSIQRRRVDSLGAITDERSRAPA